jgi:hypothetical protein
LAKTNKIIANLIYDFVRVAAGRGAAVLGGVRASDK